MSGAVEQGAKMTHTQDGHEDPAKYLTPGARAAAMGGRYAIIVAVFVGLLLISNIVAVKLINFGTVSIGSLELPMIFDGGVFLFPLVYVVGDVLAEVYGLKASRRAIYTAFGMALLTSLTIWITQLSPTALGDEHQAAFEMVLGFVPNIVIASLAAFVCGQLMNAWVLDRMRRRTSGRFLRTRLIGSTLAGQLIDTVVFCTIAFWGTITGLDFFMYTALGYLIKVLAEVVLLPVTTRVIKAVRAAEAGNEHSVPGTI